MFYQNVQDETCPSGFTIKYIKKTFRTDNAKKLGVQDGTSFYSGFSMKRFLT